MHELSLFYIQSLPRPVNRSNGTQKLLLGHDVYLTEMRLKAADAWKSVCSTLTEIPGSVEIRLVAESC